MHYYLNIPETFLQKYAIYCLLKFSRGIYICIQVCMSVQVLNIKIFILCVWSWTESISLFFYVQFTYYLIKGVSRYGQFVKIIRNVESMMWFSKKENGGYIHSLCINHRAIYVESRQLNDIIFSFKLSETNLLRSTILFCSRFETLTNSVFEKTP